MTPGEPEVEKVTHDDQRPGSTGQRPEKLAKSSLSVGRGHAKVDIADHITGRGKHVGSLIRGLDPHKSTATRVRLGVPGGVGHLPPMTHVTVGNDTISEVRVRYAETDQMGVVYHANYLVWCEIGRTDYIRRAGRSYAELERDGVLLAVSDASMRFHASARYDDPIRIHTSLTHVGSRGMTFAYRIMRADSDAVLVSATTSLVCLSRDGRLTAMPTDVRDWLTRAMAGEC